MKKWLIALITPMMIIVNSVVSFASNDYLSLTLDREQINNDETLLLKIEMNDTDRIYGMQFVLTYDFGVFTVDDLECGDTLLDAMVLKTDLNNPGVVNVAFVYDDAYEVNGELCTVKLHSRSKTGIGNTYFYLKNIEVTDPNGDLIKYDNQKSFVNIYGEIPELKPLPEQPIITPPNESEDDDPSNNSHKNGTKLSNNSNLAKDKDENGDNNSATDNKEIIEPMGFLDISGHWAYDDIEYLYYKGIINGVSETEYMPEKQLTRAEFVKMISGIMDLPKGEGINFTDVKEDDWFYDSIQKASAAQLIYGYGEEFKPYNNVTREEMAVIVDRCLTYMGAYTDASAVEDVTFDDENEFADWSYQSIIRMAKLGILKGMDGNFCPSSFTTRAQAATVIKRIYLIVTNK